MASDRHEDTEDRQDSEVRVGGRRATQDWQRFAARFHEIEDNVERVVRGKHAEIRLALVALVAEGHC